MPTVLLGAAPVNRALIPGIGFESLPPLPIATLPFKFLKSLDLNLFGKGLNGVPSSFAWELVDWKPMVHQFMAETRVKPNEGSVEMCKVVKVEDDTSEEGVRKKIDLNLGTGAEPVHDFRDVGSELLPVFENYPGDTFEKVGEVDLEEGPQTPSELIPSISTDDTLTRDGTKKRRIKTLAGHTDIPWVRKLLTQQSFSNFWKYRVSRNILGWKFLGKYYTVLNRVI